MIETALDAARAAGDILRNALGTALVIETKQNQVANLVTDADTAAERAIIDLIRSRYPDHAILGEEGGASAGRADVKWIIDPLDGTTNFAHGVPLFSVSIAAEKNGEIVAGVVYNPVADEMFAAEKGAGATLNGVPMRVSTESDITRSLLVTGFPYNVLENPDFCRERFVAFMMHVHGIRRLGSAALDCAYVAAGRLDGYWEVALQPWDQAAGVLLVREAGGTVTNFEGGPHSVYSLPFLGSNGLIHERMIEILAFAKHLRITVSGDR